MNNNFGFQEINASDLELWYAPNRNQEVKYSEIKNQLKTGDIILVDGRYSYSTLLDIIQGNRWGHAAMVVHRDDIDPHRTLGLPELMLWESNVYIENSTANLWGPVREIKEGPMLVDLQARLTHSRINFKDVVIAWRSLSTERSLFNYEQLKNHFSQVIKKKFPASNANIVLAVLLTRYSSCSNGNPVVTVSIELNPHSGEFVTKELASDRKAFINGQEANAQLSPFDPNRMYCTELIAATYKNFGILDDCPSNYAYAPRDFSEEERLRFSRPASLGREVFIDILH